MSESATYSNLAGPFTAANAWRSFSGHYLDESRIRDLEAALEHERAEVVQIRVDLARALEQIEALRQRHEPEALRHEREQSRAASLAADRATVRGVMVDAEGRPAPHGFRASRPRWFRAAGLPA